MQYFYDLTGAKHLLNLDMQPIETISNISNAMVNIVTNTVTDVVSNSVSGANTAASVVSDTVTSTLSGAAIATHAVTDTISSTIKGTYDLCSNVVDTIFQIPATTKIVTLYSDSENEFDYSILDDDIIDDISVDEYL